MPKAPRRPARDDDAVFEAEGLQAAGEELRALFMGAVSRLAPQVLEDLQVVTVNVESAEQELRDYSLREPGADSQALRPVLAWGERWNLVESDRSDPWIVETVLKSLATWLVLERAPLRLSFVYRSFANYAPGLPPLTLRAWDPQVETANRFRQRVRRELSEAMSAYIEAQKATLRRAGYRPIRLKRQHQHLEWLVRAYVLRQSPREIAQRITGSARPSALESKRRVVAKEISRLGVRLGLRRPTLRRGGRPRGSAPGK